MSAETPLHTQETREPALLTDYQRGKVVRSGIRTIRALPPFATTNGAALGDPKSGSAWLVDPYILNRKGVRFSRFTHHSGTLEVFSVVQSRLGKKEVDGKEISATISSQVQWLNLETGLPETNTDIAADRISQALEEIKSLVSQSKT